MLITEKDLVFKNENMTPEQSQESLYELKGLLRGKTPMKDPYQSSLRNRLIGMETIVASQKISDEEDSNICIKGY